MKLKTVRRLDYYIGVPLCFFISVIQSIKDCFYRKKHPEIFPKKVIFIGMSEIGSVLLSYPAVKLFKKNYPNSDIYFWIFKENSEVLNLIDFVPKKNVIVIRSKNIFILLKDILTSVWKVRNENIDTVIDLELFSRFSSILSYLSGAKNRIGFYKYTFEAPYRGNIHTHKVMYNFYYHIRKNFIFLINSFKFSPAVIPLVKEQIENDTVYLPKVSITGKNKEKIWSKLKANNNLFSSKSKIIVINAGFDDKIPIRRWPLDYYLELIKRINRKNNVFMVLIGMSPIKVLTSFSEYKNCIDIIGKTTINELVDLFNLSSVLISHDCGIVHIASLTKIHIVALFGPETPLLYGPFSENKRVFYKNFACSPCLSAFNHRRSLCVDNKCMQAITVNEIYDEIVKAVG